ncbi:Clan SB, family S8 [Tritrichomonas foetus]|uniref:Clan SB, family S8 n=1 Tax=Tritrichomonas foetus TaxID=1144522 RepID=A0A1J4KZF6_9EUKA|nr:Clan SB, family S8 [Tritrichomonas foetus]|eukprot:OHT16639.1 Clan SB, family S8 [Tritrichomonas foetus]
MNLLSFKFTFKTNLFLAASKLAIKSSPISPNILSHNEGWYLVRFLVALTISRILEIQSQTDLSFTSVNQVQPGCYAFFLTNEQFSCLIKIPEISIELLPQNIFLHKDSKLLGYEDNDDRSNSPFIKKCLVKSIPYWSPQNPKIEYTQKSTDLYVAFCDCSLLEGDSRIISLSPYKGRFAKNRYNKGFMQSGREDAVWENGSLVGHHPIYDLGIHGENQYIAVIDTGVDIFHPFFHDPNKEVQFNVTMEDHRKVYAYYNFADAQDGTNGHGTHTAGTAAGECYSESSALSLYNGMAPKAKLYIIDIGFGPSDLSAEFDNDQLYQMMYDDNVCISSNSWGLDLKDYTRPDTVLYDRMAYLHPNLIFAFAAGNEGNRYPRYYTINSPGDSKNVLSIGGVTRPRFVSIENTNLYIFETDGKQTTVKINQASKYSALLTHRTRGNPMKPYMNMTVMRYSQNITDYDSSIVVFENNGDSINAGLIMSVALKANQLNISVVVHNIQNFDQEYNSNYHAPIPILQTVDQNDFFNYIGKTASLYEKIDTSPDNYHIHLASYSSIGPSEFGFCKPDVLVTGDAFSAAGNRRDLSTGSLVSKSGTSMATPAASGMLALFRQFYTDGFYPLREKTENKGFIPTSSLLRATMINSAWPFKSDNYGPNIETGFGIPNMSTTLLESLRIIKEEKIKSREKHKYIISITQTDAPLRITMAYLDPPVSELSLFALFADLDLIVISPSGKVYTGNQRPENQQEMTNTIERVIVHKEQVETGEYSILISCSEFSDSFIDSISYSLVINGPFDHFDFITNPGTLPIHKVERCEFECKNGGRCENGTCVCDRDHTGFDCSSTVKTYNANINHNVLISPPKIEFLKIYVGHVTAKTKIVFNAKIMTTDSKAAAFIYLSENPFYSTSSKGLLPTYLTSNIPANDTLILPDEYLPANLTVFAAIRGVSYTAYNMIINITTSIKTDQDMTTPITQTSSPITQTPSPVTQTFSPDTQTSSPVTQISSPVTPTNIPTNTELPPQPNSPLITEPNSETSSCHFDFISSLPQSNNNDEFETFMEISSVVNESNESSHKLHEKKSVERFFSLIFLFVFFATLTLIVSLILFGYFLYNGRERSLIQDPFKRKENPVLQIDEKDILSIEL